MKTITLILGALLASASVVGAEPSPEKTDNDTYTPPRSGDGSASATVELKTIKVPPKPKTPKKEKKPKKTPKSGLSGLDSGSDRIETSRFY